VAAHFPPGLRRYDADDRYFVDLKKACTTQLLAFGIPPGHISISPYSTALHGEDYFSHRLEHGVTGRMMALIGLR
jgi:copper oxidase (laccase) domain-containing protein